MTDHEKPRLARSLQQWLQIQRLHWSHAMKGLQLYTDIDQHWLQNQGLQWRHCLEAVQFAGAQWLRNQKISVNALRHLTAK